MARTNRASNLRKGSPPRAPMSMPVQDLRARSGNSPISGSTNLSTRSARAVVNLGTLVLLGYAIHEIYKVVEVGGVTVLEGLFMALFAITFGWIAFAAMTAIAGLMAQRETGLEPDLSLPLSTLTALVMPVYNENPTRTAAALEAMAGDIEALGHAGSFEIMVVSDTTNADAWVRETIAYSKLQDRLQPTMPVWYRRRWKNTARKAGNIGDFVVNWGGRYSQFIVLDADSVMSGSLVISMVHKMEADNRLGILQSVPQLAGGQTLLARLQQFASWTYGPVVARGVYAWSGDDGNYWGHNAVIRTRAFAEAAGLPELKGRRPIGGHIMSHDFVEAALIRRAGWKVRMVPDVGGSFEESPPSLIDLTDRDRRWAQGNLQHLGVINAAGLAWPSRLHFATGIMSYLSSPLWLSLLLTGMLLALQAYFIKPEYFSQDYQLYPTWPLFDAERMLQLFVFTMGILFLPKIIGVVRVLVQPRLRKAAGGSRKFLLGALFELLLSALYAPIMMLTQTRQVYEIITGKDSGWKTQRRGGHGDSWTTVMVRHKWHTLIGLTLAILAWLVDPALLAWMSPALAGLIVAIPLSWLSGKPDAGLALAARGVLITGPETGIPEIIARRDGLVDTYADLPEDGLGWLSQADCRIAAQTAFNLEQPRTEPGSPDADFLTARTKLEDACSRSQALSWLTQAERLRVAADHKMLMMLNRLSG